MCVCVCVCVCVYLYLYIYICKVESVIIQYIFDVTVDFKTNNCFFFGVHLVETDVLKAK